MTKKTVKVSFVVLNWNGIDDTLLCLNSIRKQTINSYEIIVVDNGSSEKQKKILRNIPDITFIDLPRNTGFTGGQIAAYEASSGEFIALINNDAVIDPRWAEEGLATMARHSKAAAVGGKAYEWSEGKGSKAFSTKNPFYSYQVISPVTGHTRSLTYGDNECLVNSISGSGVLLRRKAITECGYFDNSFFAYYEETDLFARFKRMGYTVVYSPAMHTWHKIAQSTRSKPDFYLFMMHRNRFMFAIKNYDREYLAPFLRTYLKEWVRALAVVIRRGAKQRPEQKNLVRAGTWNLLHIFKTFHKRSLVQGTGATYSKKLIADAAESITVIIPCYNYGKYVAEAIDSVLAQTLPPDEIIVINDGSTDDSLKIIKKYTGKVKIFDQSNEGVIATKNKGLKLATGDWVVFLDADDRMRSDLLQEMYTAGRRANADIIYSAMTFIGHEDGVFWSRPYSRRSLRKGNYINNSSLMRKSLLVEIGGYNPVMSFGYEDWELYAHLAERNAKFWYVRKPLLCYRRHPENSRDKLAKKKLAKAEACIKQLHPKLFTVRYEITDLIRGIFRIRQRRTPWQLLKDVRYKIVNKLDDWSKHFMPLEKLLASCRLVAAGKLGVVWNKILLNMGRLWKKIIE